MQELTSCNEANIVILFRFVAL